MREEARIQVNADGSLTPQPWGGRYVEVQPLLFQRADGDGFLAFRTDDGGRITRLLTDRWPWTFDRLPWYETTGFRLACLGVCLSVFLATVGAGVVSLWRRPRSDPPAGWAGRLTGPVAFALSALNLVFASCFAVIMREVGLGVATAYDYGMPPAVAALLVIPVTTAALTAVLLVCVGWAWARRLYSLSRRLHYTVVTLAALAYTVLLNNLNLFGWRY